MSFEISIETELAVSGQNRPGFLHELAAELAENDVNILGVSAPPELEWGRIFLYLDDIPRGRQILQENPDVSVADRDIILLHCEDEPGIIERLTGPISEKNINIDYCYATVGDSQARLVLQTKDNEKAVSVIREEFGLSD